MKKRQRIKYDRQGKPYVCHYKAKLYLDHFFAGSDGRGFYGMSNYGGYVLELINEDYAYVTFEHN